MSLTSTVAKSTLQTGKDLAKGGSERLRDDCYMTVSSTAVQLYQGNEFYKTYQLGDLAEWGSCGDIEDAPPKLQNRLVLTKKSGKEIVFLTEKGDAYLIVKDIMKAAKALAKEMRAQGNTQNNMKAVAKGLILKRKVQKHASVSDTSHAAHIPGGKEWHSRFFVLFGGHKVVPKLM